MVTVKIGMDQWVVANTHAGTSLYTAGLSGCVAVVLESLAQIGLTHVASDAGDHNWALYEHELDLMLLVMNEVRPVRNAYMIAVGRYDRAPFTLIKGWLKKNGIEIAELAPDNGIFVCPDGSTLRNSGLSIDVKNKGYRRLFEPEAAAAITNWGKLSGQAGMPSKAIGGVAENEDDYD